MHLSARPRVRLRMGIALAFLAVMLPLALGMVGALYIRNSELAVQMAERSMDNATRDIVGAVRGAMNPVAHAVDATVAFSRVQQGSMDDIQSLRPLMETLEHLPELYSIYVAGSRDGSFRQVVRLSPKIVKFGPEGRRPPPEAQFVIRLVDDSSGEMRDSYIYLAKWGEVVGVERGDVHYDPRTRPWYQAALGVPGVVSSGIYPFASTGRPGLTLSRRLTTTEGAVMGVVGADLATDALSHFLDERRVGQHGKVFVLDENNRLIGYPDPDRVVAQEADGPTIIKADQMDDPLVAGAVRRRAAGAGDRFTAPLGDKGQSYLVAFTSFPEDFGKHWVIGAVAAEDDFVGPLRHASLVILMFGSGFILLASAGVVGMSRLLTRPILTVIAETEDIRRLQLEDRPPVVSVLTEIAELSQSVAAMRTALRSFTSYVPKGLVRDIVASGIGTEIGGERRPLTVMFSDVKEFVFTTESLPPEELLQRLSTYFECLSGVIHTHGGTVDKYIGDAIMAFWNAPMPDDDHVARGCRGMLACRAANDALNAQFLAHHWKPLRTRFGMHTGLAVVGNVGSHDRMQYTALGAMVNLASRIEGLNKRYGTDLLVTGAVEQLVNPRFLFRQVEVVVPYGASAPVALHELIGELDPASPLAASAEDIAHCAQWREAFAAYLDRDWGRAREGFAEYLSLRPGDGAATLLLKQASGYQENPPPPHWDGAVRFARK